MMRPLFLILLAAAITQAEVITTFCTPNTTCFGYVQTNTIGNTLSTFFEPAAVSSAPTMAGSFVYTDAFLTDGPARMGWMRFSIRSIGDGVSNTQGTATLSVGDQDFTCIGVFQEFPYICANNALESVPLGQEIDLLITLQARGSNQTQFNGGASGIWRLEASFFEDFSTGHPVNVTHVPVPEPGSIGLCGTGLFALGVFLRRTKWHSRTGLSARAGTEHTPITGASVSHSSAHS